MGSLQEANPAAQCISKGACQQQQQQQPALIKACKLSLTSMGISSSAQHSSSNRCHGSSWTATSPNSQTTSVQVATSSRHQIRSQASSSLAAAVVLLLFVSLSGVCAAPTQCRVQAPVCPSRSEALARKPVFDMDTPQQVVLEAGNTAHSKRTHKPTGQAASSLIPHMTKEAAAHLLAGVTSRQELLLVPGTGARAGDMPQRVLPTADLPLMSQSAQQQLFTQLLRVLKNDAVNSSIVVGGPGAAPAPARDPHTQVFPTGCGGSGCSMMFLTNARLRVGVDTQRGGAITFVSSPIMPPEWANINLVNTWDAGRLIQQSYYGCYDNTCWVDRPWRWNPVQGGSWQNGPPKLLASSMGAASVTVASVPRNWGGQQLLDDVLMVTEAELHPNVAKVRFTMRYTGEAPHPNAHQEVPAIFVHRRLNVLALYTGDKPWSNDALTFVMPGQVGEYFRPTERWAAYVDQSSGFGLGVYTPVANQLVAYRIGPEASTARSDVSYMAPLVTANIQPNTEFHYDAYVAVGRVDEIRAWFAEIAARVAPKNEAGSYQRPLPAVLSPKASQRNDEAAAGRSASSARTPRISLLLEPQVPAVQPTPGGGDGVKFAKAMESPDLYFDSKIAPAPPAGVSITPKPTSMPSKKELGRRMSSPVVTTTAVHKAVQPMAAASSATPAHQHAAAVAPNALPVAAHEQAGPVVLGRRLTGLSHSEATGGIQPTSADKERDLRQMLTQALQTVSESREGFVLADVLQDMEVLVVQQQGKPLKQAQVLQVVRDEEEDDDDDEDDDEDKEATPKEHTQQRKSGSAQNRHKEPGRNWRSSSSSSSVDKRRDSRKAARATASGDGSARPRHKKPTRTQKEELEALIVPLLMPVDATSDTDDDAGSHDHHRSSQRYQDSDTKHGQHSNRRRRARRSQHSAKSKAAAAALPSEHLQTTKKGGKHHQAVAQRDQQQDLEAELLSLLNAKDAHQQPPTAQDQDEPAHKSGKQKPVLNQLAGMAKVFTAVAKVLVPDNGELAPSCGDRLNKDSVCV